MLIYDLNLHRPMDPDEGSYNNSMDQNPTIEMKMMQEYPDFKKIGNGHSRKQFLLTYRQILEELQEKEIQDKLRNRRK